MAGEWVSPLDVATGASRGLHSVSSGVRFTPGGGGGTAPLFFGTLDAAVARWDAPLPFPSPLDRQPDLAEGLSYLLHDNVWNTNFPFWYPFAPGDPGNLVFRFTLGLR